MVLSFHQHNKNRAGYWLSKYEDAVGDPENFLIEACHHFGLETNNIPFERIKSLPVIGSSTTRKEGIGWMKKPKDFNPVGRWQNWSRWRKWTFKRIAGESLMKLGYCHHLNW
jgi:hypothetical protein